MAYDQAAADWQREATDARERIAVVLAELDGVMPGFLAPETHAGECWRIHVGCLAARIRRTLTGEDHHDD